MFRIDGEVDSLTFSLQSALLLQLLPFYLHRARFPANRINRSDSGCTVRIQSN